MHWIKNYLDIFQKSEKAKLFFNFRLYMGLVLVCVNLYVVTFGIKKIKEVGKRT